MGVTAWAVLLLGSAGIIGVLLWLYGRRSKQLGAVEMSNRQSKAVEKALKEINEAENKADTRSTADKRKRLSKSASD